jgi:hypothetical protein
MAKRTCQSNEDLKQIWRLLLPDMPFPACEPPENSGAQPRASETSTCARDKSPADSGTR